MSSTDEQLAVIHHQDNAAVDAAPGSGKTTTLVEYAKLRPDKRILYLTYNSDMREVAKVKFGKANCTNVTCHTAHSLAHGKFYKRYYAKTAIENNLSFNLVKSILGEPLHSLSANLSLTKHVRKLYSYFCNSNDLSVKIAGYAKECVPTDKEFITQNARFIVKLTADLFEGVRTGKYPLTHDFYLKGAQLTKIALDEYDIILFDEAQDASPVMIDIVDNAKAIKVYVGDSDQQIYSWRHAKNALAGLGEEFTRFQLTNSFRFNQEMADRVNAISEMKKLYGEQPSCRITGVGNPEVKTEKAILARTNAGIINHALAQPTSSRLYFSGGLNKYLYTDDGIGVYDVVNMAFGQRDRCQNQFLLGFRDGKEFFDYAEEAEDPKLNTIITLATTYKTSIFSKIKILKDQEEKNIKKATLIYSSAHAAKGSEFSQVELLGDGFIVPEKILSLMESGEFEKEKVREEINIHFVAASRAECVLINPNDPHVERVQKTKSNSPSNWSSSKGEVDDFDDDEDDILEL